mgnify:CR=1 FL=1
MINSVTFPGISGDCSRKSADPILSRRKKLRWDPHPGTPPGRPDNPPPGRRTGVIKANTQPLRPKRRRLSPRACAVAPAYCTARTCSFSREYIPGILSKKINNCRYAEDTVRFISANKYHSSRSRPPALSTNIYGRKHHFFIAQNSFL